VELLVVVAIIGVLMGLLLPAVQGAREAGRRVACSNNQYQLALGMNRFNEANGFLPGWRNSLVLSSATLTPGWPLMIMPFIERNDIYRSVSSLPGNYTTMTTYLSLFICPSSPPDVTTGPWLAYAGNCGSASNFRRFDGVMQDTTFTSGSTSGRVSLDDVANGDGTSMTLILSEKCITGTAGLVQGFWNNNFTGSTGAFTFANGNATSALFVPGFGLPSTTSTQVINPTGLGIGNTTGGQIIMPSSNHPGGVVAAFCDGRTGFLRQSLLGRVYAQLLSWSHRNATSSAGGLGASSVYSVWGTTTVLDESEFQ
jgi:type II secretory pathway pseudopilin PulG